MTNSLKLVRQKLQNVFSDARRLTAEENRLFACIENLSIVKKVLEQRFLPLEEVNSSSWQDLNGDKPAYRRFRHHRRKHGRPFNL